MECRQVTSLGSRWRFGVETGEELVGSGSKVPVGRTTKIVERYHERKVETWTSNKRCVFSLENFAFTLVQ